MQIASSLGDSLYEMPKPILWVNFPWKIGFGISPEETICMKCQSLFSAKN